MKDLGFDVVERSGVTEDGNTCEVFVVPGPDLTRDRLVDLVEGGVAAMAQRFGVRPSRASVSRWRKYGYPIDRNGPRVILPAAIRIKRVSTSHPALLRWFTLIQAIGEDIRAAGGVSAWRKARNHERKTA